MGQPRSVKSRRYTICGPVETAVIVKENLEAFFNAYPQAANKILRQIVRVLAARLHQANISYSSLMHIAESIGDE